MLQPSDPRIELMRNAGFTAAVSFPSQGFFCGEGVMFNLAGGKSGAMVVMTPAGQRLALSGSGSGGGFPSSLMGAVAYIRQV
jgi:hypothetical protein